MSMRTTQTPRRAKHQRWFLLMLTTLVGISFSLSLVGCEEEKDPKEEAALNLPPANVNLPSVPADLGVPKTPEKNPDGSLTVYGLLRNRPKYLKKEISVKGYIASVYDCPHWEKNQPKKPNRKKPVRKKPKKDDEAESDPKMCQRPHFYINDKPGTKADENSLLVVRVSTFIQDQIDEEKINAGEQHVLTGTFIDISEGFTAADKGLLELVSIKGFDPSAEEDSKN